MLENYDADTLYKIYLRSLSEAYVEDEPLDANHSAHLAWEEKVCRQEKELSEMFAKDARELFLDVVLASENQDTSPWLYKLFAAQAGAMTNMAGQTAALILATNQKPIDSYADRSAMFNIILTFIQSVFTGKDHTGVLKTQLAYKELIQALFEKEWIALMVDEQAMAVEGEAKMGSPVWSSTKKLKTCASGGGASNSPVMCDDTTGKCAYELTMPFQIELLTRDDPQDNQPFCEPITLYKGVVADPPPVDGTNQAKSKRKAILQQDPAIVKTALGETVNDFFKYISPKDGLIPRQLTIKGIKVTSRVKDEEVTYTFYPPFPNGPPVLTDKEQKQFLELTF